MIFSLLYLWWKFISKLLMGGVSLVWRVGCDLCGRAGVWTGSTTVRYTGEGAIIAALSWAAGLWTSQGAIYTHRVWKSNKKSMKQILSMFYTSFTTEKFHAHLLGVCTRKFAKCYKIQISCDIASTENDLIFRYKNTDILKNVHISNLLSMLTEFKFTDGRIKIQQNRQRSPRCADQRGERHF